MAWLQKIKQFCKVHQLLLLYLAGAAVVLFALNYWLWPTPDEYFYAILAENFRAALNGQMIFGDIHTEHVGLVAFITAAYQYVVHPNTLLASRVPIFGFSLGIMILIYQIAATLGLSIKERMSWLLLLLLIPGYWIFSVRLMLDIPGTFGAILVLYLLLKKAPSYQVGLGLLLLLLLKEYYVYLLAPLVGLVIFFDVWQSSDTPLKKITAGLVQLLFSFMPTALATLIMIDFNWLPYPRALELNMIGFFGDLFSYTNKTFLSLLNNTIKLVYHPATQTIVDTVNTTSVVIPTEVIAEPTMVDQVAIPTEVIAEPALVDQVVIPTEVIAEPTKLDASIQQITFSGEIPTALFQTDGSPYGDGLRAKLWYIYQYNFSETDINIFILPASCIGLWLAIKKTYDSLRTQRVIVRTNLIFIVYFLIFAYLNYHQASLKHGFRITLPIIIALIYFSYLAGQILLKKINLRYSIAFAVLSVLAIILYVVSLQATIYGSVLSHQGIFVILLNLKPYIMVAAFSTMLVLLLLFARFKSPKKYSLLIACVLALFVVKLTPFYFENRQALGLYDYDYGLATTTPLLQQSVKTSAKILSNMNPNKLQYYSGDIHLATEGVSPIIRIFSKSYPTLYYGYLTDGDLLDQLVSHEITTVLLSNDKIDESFRHTLEAIIAAHPAAFTKTFERYNGDRLQWAIYHFNAQAL